MKNKTKKIILQAKENRSNCIQLLHFPVFSLLVSLPKKIILNIFLLPVIELGLCQNDETLCQQYTDEDPFESHFLLAELTQRVLDLLPDLLLFTGETQSKRVMDVIAGVAVFQQSRELSREEPHLNSCTQKRGLFPTS